MRLLIGERRRQNDNSFLVLEYAEFLKDVEKAFLKNTKNLATDGHRFTQIEENDKQFQISNVKFQKDQERSQIIKFLICVHLCPSVVPNS